MYLEVDVTKSFAEFQCRVKFSLDTKKCGVFGPSGSGKSTLMSMLAGLLQPDEGHIRPGSELIAVFKASAFQRLYDVSENDPSTDSNAVSP